MMNNGVIMKKFVRSLWMVFPIFCLLLAPAFADIFKGAQSDFILPQYSKRVSLDFKDADLRDVLKAFSRQIGANFIISDKVKAGPVTVMLEDVPVEDALKAILAASGLSSHYDQNDNILVINPGDVDKKNITRVYPLKYATVSVSKLLSTFSISEDSDSSSSGGSSSGDSSSGGSSSGGASSKSSGGSSSGSSGGGTLVDSLKTVLSSSAKIAEDPRTNSLIISDQEDNFPAIERILAKLDVPVAQILIEVQMIDTTKQAIDQVGVKFGNTLYQINGLGGKKFYFPFDQTNILNKGGTLGYTSGALSGSSFSAVLQYLNTRTDTKSLARPRLLTMDNETAQIKITAQEVIGVKLTAATANTAQTQEPERTETGIVLTVTPQLNLITGDILMAVSPKVIEARTGGTFNGETYKDPEVRGAKVKMSIHNGDTIVLGGLLRKEQEKVVNKLPLLGDIPFLGRLFRHDNVTTQDRELLIFITPRLVENTSGMAPDRTAVGLGAREGRMLPRDNAVSSALDHLGDSGFSD